MARPKGTPTKCTPDVLAEAIRMIAVGSSLPKAAEKLGVSKQGLWDALNEPSFIGPYTRAMVERGNWYAERAIEVAEEPIAPGDSAAVNDKRLRVDTYKWFASRLNPKRWGDRLEVSGLGDALSGVVVNMVLTPREPNAVLKPHQDDIVALPAATVSEDGSESS